MRQQRSRVRRMPQVLVKTSTDKLMIVPDDDDSREVFAERVNGGPTNSDACHQEKESEQADDGGRRLNMTDAGKAEHHSHRLDGVDQAPELRGILVPILRRPDSGATKIPTLHYHPDHANGCGKNGDQHNVASAERNAGHYT